MGQNSSERGKRLGVERYSCNRCERWFISLYKRRHLMEEFYRDSKQNLGWASTCSGRGHEAVNRHWYLRRVQRPESHEEKGNEPGQEVMIVGQLCEWVEERCE